MSAPGDVADPPSRAELVERIQALIEGTTTREIVSDWAVRWVRLPEPNVNEPAVWKAIQRLSGADLRASRDKYLHSEDDFRAWLTDLESS